MRVDDFCRCTPSEFTAIWTVWNDGRQTAERGEWERVRMQCLCSLQPYSKNRLSPQDIMRFPWEETTIDHEEVSDDEKRARFDEVKKRLGLE